MDFSSVNTVLWNVMMQFGFIAAVMLVSNALRRKVPVIRKSLMPTAVIAGFLALSLRMSSLLPVDSSFMEMVTYHTIALGFIALSLRVPSGEGDTDKGDLIAAKSGALIVSSYLIQGILGLLITIGLAFTFMPKLFKAAGILLPMGYGQGPGQANNVGSTYEVLGFVGGQSFGLSIAAVGFLCACVVGVTSLNLLYRKGKFTIRPNDVISGSVTLETFQNENEIPIEESIDRFSIQAAMVLLVYLFTFFISDGITGLLNSKAPGVGATLSPLIWGFNFIIGSLLAIVFRKFMAGLMKAKVMTRQYLNNYLLSRISGAAFDLMVIAGIASINIKDLKGLWVPFLLMTVLGCILTYYYLKWICKKLYPQYYYEAMLSMFGMMTGTISSGVLLLREIDPSFKTPAANNLLTGTSAAIVFGAPMLILIGMAPKSTALLFMTLGLMVVYFVLLLLFMLKAKGKR
jgi:ESS family glutamate:Na+ symporter